MRSFIANIFSLDQNGMVVAELVPCLLICPTYICLASLWISVLIICPQIVERLDGSVGVLSDS